MAPGLAYAQASAQVPGRGTLIDASPIVQTPAGAQAWRVRYWTTNDAGQRIAVSGFVVAPREALPARPRNVLAWAHGTWGVVDKCALSYAVLWNAFKKMAAGYSEAEKDSLFRGTATRVYKLKA